MYDDAACHNINFYRAMQTPALPQWPPTIHPHSFPRHRNYVRFVSMASSAFAGHTRGLEYSAQLVRGKIHCCQFHEAHGTAYRVVIDPPKWWESLPSTFISFANTGLSGHVDGVIQIPVDIKADTHSREYAGVCV